MYGVSLSTISDRIVVIGCESGEVFIRTLDGQHVATLHAEDAVTSIAVVEPNHALVISAARQRAAVWRNLGGSWERVRTLGGSYHACVEMKVSRALDLVVGRLGTMHNDSVVVWDYQTGEMLDVIAPGGTVTSIDIAQRAPYVLVDASVGLRIIDLTRIRASMGSLLSNLAAKLSDGRDRKTSTDANDLLLQLAPDTLHADLAKLMDEDDLAQSFRQADIWRRPLHAYCYAPPLRFLHKSAEDLDCQNVKDSGATEPIATSLGRYRTPVGRVALFVLLGALLVAGAVYTYLRLRL